MPQFDFFSFFTQIFWFLLFVVFLYLLCLYYPLRLISEHLKMKAKIQSLYLIMLKGFTKKEIYKKCVTNLFKKNK
jgi:hypothetical protein